MDWGCTDIMCLLLLVGSIQEVHCVHLLACGAGRVLDWLELVDRSTLPEDWRRESLVW